MPESKPLILVAGFLGVGKTTLIRTLLARLAEAGLAADIILNDIANADLDAASIAPDTAASIAPLAASCACCESLDELVKLCQSARRGTGDLLVIELNGTADPTAIIESFTLLHDQLNFTPVLQVSVIDVRHWGERGELDPLERRQMDTAGLHLLSHTDQVDEPHVQRVAEMVSDRFPDSRQITADWLAEALIAKSPIPSNLRGTSDAPSTPHASGHDETHLLSHQVKGYVVPLPPKVRRAAIERLLQRLPAGVLRAKALVKLVEEPGPRWLFERSGTEVAPHPLPVPDISNVATSLLCVGLRLEPEPIRELVSKAFGTNPSPVS